MPSLPAPDSRRASRRPARRLAEPGAPACPPAADESDMPDPPASSGATGPRRFRRSQRRMVAHMSGSRQVWWPTKALQIAEKKQSPSPLVLIVRNLMPRGAVSPYTFRASRPAALAALRSAWARPPRSRCGGTARPPRESAPRSRSSHRHGLPLAAASARLQARRATRPGERPPAPAVARRHRPRKPPPLPLGSSATARSSAACPGGQCRPK
eukprot:scaffold2475_cov115-Isochrysis_galbana.AAC.6